MKLKNTSSIFYIFLFFLIFACGCELSQEKTNLQEVNVYTHRHYDADIKLFEEFTKQSGIKINVVKSSADNLMYRMELEGQNSPADVLLTVDAGRLYRAKAKGLLQPIESEIITKAVPSHLRDVDNQWISLTQRARIIVYAKEKVKPSDLSTYEALTDQRWKGKILISASENTYNQSLLASILAHKGEAVAKKWAEGIVKNFARQPKGSDTDQVMALVAGEGELAIVNTYYVAKMLISETPDSKGIKDKIGVFFPNQDERGAHFNVSGAGIAKYAPNKANAVKLLAFLCSEQAQQIFAEANQEYPVREGVEASKTLQSFGKFRADTLPLSWLGKYNTNAVKIFDQVGWK
jgi:iron(III) transport system substrate-binding protein